MFYQTPFSMSVFPRHLSRPQDAGTYRASRRRGTGMGTFHSKHKSHLGSTLLPRPVDVYGSMETIQKVPYSGFTQTPLVNTMRTRKTWQYFRVFRVFQLQSLKLLSIFSLHPIIKLCQIFKLPYMVKIFFC
jgi:hypothetical protein